MYFIFFNYLIFFVYVSSQTAVELIHCVPDIACFGKLMTGGIIPLAATLATNDVFDSFIGDSKVRLFLERLCGVGHGNCCILDFDALMEWVAYYADIIVVYFCFFHQPIRLLNNFK